MFGKGVYFADMVSKSANYCRTSKSDPTGLMLLCEVSLGNMSVSVYNSVVIIFCSSATRFNLSLLFINLRSL